MSLVIVMHAAVAWFIGVETVRAATSPGGVITGIVEAILWPLALALALLRVACDAVSARFAGRRV